MYIQLIDFKSKIFNFVIMLWGIVIEVFRAIKWYLRVNLLYRRNTVIRLLAERQQLQSNSPRVIAAIAHITSVEEAKNREKGLEKIEKLKHTIDGLISSFAHCQLTIVIKTVAGRNIIGYLPEYQISCIDVQEESGGDPMFIGFRCQDELVERYEDFDWFLFLEDDIILHDSFILEKLEKFNNNCGYDRAVLLPNRYELWEGKKAYIDFTIDKDLAWNRLSTVEVESVKFAEFTNPHSGFYCLSKSQIKIWIESGREWKDKDLGFGGPRESAATYCLLECFSLYKPHPSNLHFFEVRHYDTKYSRLYPGDSSYIFSPMKGASKLEQALEGYCQVNPNVE